MPTDLDAVSARKREAQAQTRTLVTIMFVWVIISLGVIGLLFEIVRQ
jgi:heme/copper-type cytochrome/quinol oxidase subunit 2